jgi:hypothetical protein
MTHRHHPTKGFMNATGANSWTPRTGWNAIASNERYRASQYGLSHRAIQAWRRRHAICFLRG